MKQAVVAPEVALLADHFAAESAPLTRLIAQLSLCMLAAAFGGTVGQPWCRWWAIFGAFGLASATGCDVLNRSYVLMADRTRRKQFTRKAQRKLDAMMDDLQSSCAISAALRELQPDAADPTPRRTNGQDESRLSLNRPATITPLLRNSCGAVQRLGERQAGRLRNISRYGFGLAHDQRLDRGLVLLRTELADGRPLQFIADVLWCELRGGGGYFSGGKLLEVVTARDLRPGQ
jgi:hypothetical protein